MLIFYSILFCTTKFPVRRRPCHFRLFRKQTTEVSWFWGRILGVLISLSVAGLGLWEGDTQLTSNGALDIFVVQKNMQDTVNLLQLKNKK